MAQSKRKATSSCENRGKKERMAVAKINKVVERFEKSSLLAIIFQVFRPSAEGEGMNSVQRKPEEKNSSEIISNEMEEVTD